MYHGHLDFGGMSLASVNLLFSFGDLFYSRFVIVEGGAQKIGNMVAADYKFGIRWR